MPQRNDGEESMRERDSLSVDQIEERSWNAADKLIKALEDFNGESIEDIDSLREELASECVSLLVQRFSMPVPAVLTE